MWLNFQIGCRLAALIQSMRSRSSWVGAHKLFPQLVDNKCVFGGWMNYLMRVVVVGVGMIITAIIIVMYFNYRIATWTAH